MKTPKGFKLGKKIEPHGIQTSGNISYCNKAQIFLQCCQKPIPEECHDTVALIPIGVSRNEIVNNFTDKQAEDFFSSLDWLIKGVNGSLITRCPHCARLQ